ncbi:MAG: DUF5791 family protein [Halobacteriaceae archaeon]
MLHEDVEDADDITAADLRRRYERAVAGAVEAAGIERAAEETGVEADRLEALLAEEAVDLTMEEAAAALALSDDYPDAESILLEVRDSVMLGMSSAVLDVDALAADLPELGPREIQQKIEGRQPMTLDEYARINHLITVRNPY